ncbi:MAG: glycoside hydrolase family 71/99-like protein [Pirellulales bacterium]
MSNRAAILTVAALFVTATAHAADPTREDVIAKTMKPYTADSAAGVDRTSLKGKIFCGYQGWFGAEGDGAGRAWALYGRRGKFEPGRCSIDLWPDVSELDADEKYATPFRRADGSVAHVFSSYNKKTVLRHFRWMQEYGIDGVFVQRFAVETFHPRNLDHCTTVLAHCREGANRHGRVYAVMYDLSGLGAGQMSRVIDDWKLLVDRMRLGRDANDRAYLHERGKPVVAVWGVGFNDGGRYTLAECEELVRFLKLDKQYGGATVVLGVPSGWRTLDGDSVGDRKLHDVILQADIISPWTVGRYVSPKTAIDHAQRRWKEDIAWCRERDKAYLPVAFPGFSWHNMKPDFPLDQIPRLGGKFLWTQYAQAKKVGATMIYQAMFDELDEGTAIFKCTNDPPVGKSRFVAEPGLPSDHYLWLTGMGGGLLRGEIEPTDALPARR